MWRTKQMKGSYFFAFMLHKWLKIDTNLYQQLKNKNILFKSSYDN